MLSGERLQCRHLAARHGQAARPLCMSPWPMGADAPCAPCLVQSGGPLGPDVQAQVLIYCPNCPERNTYTRVTARVDNIPQDKKDGKVQVGQAAAPRRMPRTSMGHPGTP